MKVGIDISQAAFTGTGVGNYIDKLVSHLAVIDQENEYILFFSSLRRKNPLQITAPNIRVKSFIFPPTFLDLLWNKLHIFPVEWFIGKVDVFITSDWTEPPTIKARKATILYDLIVYKHPEETAEKIIDVQKRKLAWVKKESDIVLCISEATKKDCIDILKLDERKVRVIYPGI